MYTKLEVTLSWKKTTPTAKTTADQEIVDLTGKETFAKELKVKGTKVDARVVQQKKTTGFSRMSVKANLLCFGSFAAG